MSKVIHFEIHVDDMERAKQFYRNVFGWIFQDWSDYAGMAYWGAEGADPEEPGINGALMQRQSPGPREGQPISAYVCTMGVENYDLTEQKILENGGKAAMPKAALTGMAWQGYYHDTEGNIFGIHQPDVNAK